MRLSDRRGFILPTMIWALALVGIVASAYLAEAHHLSRVSINRDAELFARQAALSGLARVRARVERMHRLSGGEGSPDPAARASLLLAWNRPDSVFAPIARGCIESACYQLEVRDLGASLNVNTAGEERLRSLFLYLGVTEGEASLAAQSIADWIDGDDRARFSGAEAPYYSSVLAGYAPRNGPIPDLRELRRVRGVDQRLLDLAGPYLSVTGSGRVNLNTAPPPVLASLPGIGPAAVEAIMSRRARGELIPDPLRLLGMLRFQARTQAEERFTELKTVAITEPEELEVISVGSFGRHPVRVPFRAHLLRSAKGVLPLQQSRLDL